MVRPISTTAPLQFNNNNSVHVVNPSLPAYTLPSDYGLNLSSKLAESKSTEVKDAVKRNCEEDSSASRQNSANSGKVVYWILLLLIVKLILVYLVFPDSGSNASSDRTDRDTTVPLNLSADTADDKKAKRAASEAENVELDRMKRVKTEQTEATDLSMKNSGPASQTRPSSHSVRIIVTVLFINRNNFFLFLV